MVNSDNAPGYPGLYKSGAYSTVVTVNGAVSGTTIVVRLVLILNVNVGDIVTGTNDLGDPFALSIISINSKYSIQ